MVDPVSVYLGCTLGSYDAASEKDAHNDKDDRISAGMRAPWLCLWNAVCTGTGVAVWIQLGANSGVDRVGFAVGYDPWYQ